MRTKPLVPGDRVVIADGAFETMEGVVSSYQEPGGSIRIVVTIYGREVSMDYLPNQLRLVTDRGQNNRSAPQ